MSITGPLPTTVTAAKIILAVGTVPARPDHVDFDDELVVDSDGILRMPEVPRTMIVVGAGVIGIEYASMFAALGTRVTVVDARDNMLDFCDSEVVESLRFHLRDLSVSFRFGETVDSVQVNDRGTLTTLASGKRIPADTAMYSAGRQGATAGLRLERAGLEADKRGRVTVDQHFRTEVDHIYAVGDVIGFPALAATSMEQGRLAALHAMDQETREITASSVPYEVGISRYRELARGQIAGDTYGMLKLLVHSDERTLLGVDIFGTGATDLVHIGQAVMGCGGTIDYLIDTVFNYPTLSEAYKVAALDAHNKLRALDGFVDEPL